MDLGLATLRDLAVAPPTLFWYELGEAHRLLWARPGEPPQLPRIRLGDIDPAEGSRLLLNRGLALLWAGARLWSGSGPGSGSVTEDPAELRFATIAAHKAVSAAGDAALLRGNAYTPSQSGRQAVLLESPRSHRVGCGRISGRLCKGGRLSSAAHAGGTERRVGSVVGGARAS